MTNLQAQSATPLAEQIAEILEEAGSEGIINLLEFYEYFNFVERNFLRQPNERNQKIKKGSAIILAIGNVWFQEVAKA